MNLFEVVRRTDEGIFLCVPTSKGILRDPSVNGITHERMPTTAISSGEASSNSCDGPWRTVVHRKSSSGKLLKESTGRRVGWKGLRGSRKTD